MALTQDQIAQQLVAQLRALDPSASAEIGTPERKILDTVAQGIAEAQIDLNLLSSSTDVTAKYGSDLDNYVGLFGFGRQSGSNATGFVTFSRLSPSAYDIAIPNGTQVQGSFAPTNDDSGNAATVTFQTTATVTLAAAQTSVSAPIQALLSGSAGSVAANTITQFANIGAPVLGITTVINPLPTTNGADPESDAELKVRFTNTVFRNMAGTYDQYMALAVSTQFSTKANVLGPISRFQEYIQVPAGDDSTTTIDGPGGGAAGQWTTAPSQNPYAQYVYAATPYFVSTNPGAGQIFYRQDTDFVLNVPPLNAGDTHREFLLAEILDPATTPFQPNVTYFNVYTGTDDDVIAPVPGEVDLLEYSYLSAESRNDIVHNITNCVDVYVNGQNPITADAVLAPITTAVTFSLSPTSPFYYQNYRRIGQPDVTPVATSFPSTTHIFTGLFWEPVIALPAQIVANGFTYLLGIHYFAVEDKTLIGNTVRSRNGIEWDPTINGLASGDDPVAIWTTEQSWPTLTTVFYNGHFYESSSALTNDTVVPSSDPGNWTPVSDPFTGQPIISAGGSSLTVSGYTYDKNIVDLQTALEGAKQITTDVLAHRSATRYYKLDVTIIYATGQTAATVNNTISFALANFFAGQYFGTTIQLTDLLTLIRSQRGVQNVRWSFDDDSAFHKVTECDASGNPRFPAITYDSDFFLRDNELPALPASALPSDSMPGLIARSRAQNTFALP